VLEFAEDELGDENGSFHEAGLSDVSDAAIDDHAGIQNLGVLAPGKIFRKEFPIGEVKFLSFFKADLETDISTNPIKHPVKGKDDLLMVKRIGEKDIRDEIGNYHSED
jgi:hypothetical protein